MTRIREFDATSLCWSSFDATARTKRFAEDGIPTLGVGTSQNVGFFLLCGFLFVLRAWSPSPSRMSLKRDFGKMGHDPSRSRAISSAGPRAEMGITDYIGGRGEAIAFARLAAICRTNGNRPYFWPHFLGEKCETFDFLVELFDAGEKTPFFFVQVKTTQKDFTRSQAPARLKVGVSEKDIRRMVAYPAPTYVVGVHEDQERAFIVSVHGTMSRAIPSITTAYELNDNTLKQLWDEVREFWQGHDMTQYASSFLN
jgi:hypothetical protein